MRNGDKDLDLLARPTTSMRSRKARVTIHRNALPRAHLRDEPGAAATSTMMHALTMRTDVVRSLGVGDAEHLLTWTTCIRSFPFPTCAPSGYLTLTLPLLHRSRRPVRQRKVMTTRLDQLARVNRAMTEAHRRRGPDVEDKLWRYMVHYLRINAVA